MTRVPTVFVVEDEAPMRELVRGILVSAGFVVETYPSARHFLSAVPADAPVCVVTDLQMPEMTGPALQRALSERSSLLPCIVLSGRADIPAAVEALKNGAVEFFEKPVRPLQLLNAVGAALHRNSELRRREAERSAAREHEVLDLIVAGHANKAVASRLGISPNTVENHRAAIMRKTGADHLAELVRLVAAAEPPAPPY